MIVFRGSDGLGCPVVGSCVTTRATVLTEGRASGSRQVAPGVAAGILYFVVCSFWCSWYLFGGGVGVRCVRVQVCVCAGSLWMSWRDCTDMAPPEKNEGLASTLCCVTVASQQETSKTKDCFHPTEHILGSLTTILSYVRTSGTRLTLERIHSAGG